MNERATLDPLSLLVNATLALSGKAEMYRLNAEEARRWMLACMNIIGTEERKLRPRVCDDEGERANESAA